MNFMDVLTFDLKQGKTREFQQWLSGNEEKLAAECPQGVSYKGTYALVRSSEKNAGSFMQVFEYDSYGAMDAFSQAMKDGGTFANLMDELTEFTDQDNHANWSNLFGRRVTDAAIWGE